MGRPHREHSRCTEGASQRGTVALSCRGSGERGRPVWDSIGFKTESFRFGGPRPQPVTMVALELVGGGAHRRSGPAGLAVWGGVGAGLYFWKGKDRLKDRSWWGHGGLLARTWLHETLDKSGLEFPLWLGLEGALSYLRGFKCMS